MPVPGAAAATPCHPADGPGRTRTPAAIGEALTRAGGWALGLFCEHLLQNHFIEREVPDQLLELAVLLLQLPEPPDLRDGHLPESLPPVLVGGFADPEAARHLGNRRAGLDVPQGRRNLAL